MTLAVLTQAGHEGSDAASNLTGTEPFQISISTPDAPAGSVSINDVSITEGTIGSMVATFTVTRSGGTAAFAVTYFTSDGGATIADNDYNANSGTLNFGDGVDTQTISVIVNNDSKFEADETFFVNLSTATDGATISDNLGIGTIVNDDDPPPAGSVSINDMSITEGDGGSKLATFTVTRVEGTRDFDVNFITSDGSATNADSDYVARSGTLTFAAGVSTQTFSITINGDTRFESDETFFVNLSGATHGAFISDDQGIGTITNDDPANLFAPLTAQIAAFAPGPDGWVTNDRFPRELADVNHDGMADIVGFGGAGVYVSLATGNGAFGPVSFKLGGIRCQRRRLEQRRQVSARASRRQRRRAWPTSSASAAPASMSRSPPAAARSGRCRSGRRTSAPNRAPAAGPPRRSFRANWPT